MGADFGVDQYSAVHGARISRGADARVVRIVETAKSIEVVHFQRRALVRQYSVERLFDDVRKALPRDIRVTLRINKYPSQGIFNRVYDTLSARVNRGPVNHVLGDVQYLASFLPRDRTIVTVLDCVSLERLTGIKRWVLWLFWYWWPLKRSAHVTVISEFSGEALRRWVRYPAERIHVIPPTLSSEFQPSPRVPDHERPRLLQVGTRPNKNLERVVEAIAGLEVSLVIVGTPDEEIRARMKILGIEHEVHVDLSREELVEEYRQADIVIFASTYEGFGLPIIEAQAIGRPVVAGNVCAMPEAAGDAACMVDPFDVADIRRGICRLLEDSEFAEALIERGFANARRYAPERIAEAYAEVYRLVAES
jgi:glycosyltransferase involved in cell wall biosynthesis